VSATVAGDPPSAPGPDDAAAVLRRGVLALALGAIAVTAAELASERHWGRPVRLIPWACLALLLLSVLVIVGAARRSTLLAARAAAVLVVAGSAVGVWEHLEENLGAGPLDRRYASSWDAMSPLQHVWKAASGAVGPAPLLAPGILAGAAVLVLLATARHPALRR
jgi:UPF0716 family protein affecting phage T7 exclusion